MQQGNALADQGWFEQAIARYLHALSLKPDYADAHICLGNALAAQGKPDQAVAQYRQALALKPDYAEVHSNLANVLGVQGKTGLAVTHYRRALSLKPDYADAYYNLGNLLAKQGEKDEAIANYGRALSLRPDYTEAHNNLGNLLAVQGKIESALAHYQRALLLKPDYAEAHNNLGNLLAAQYRTGEAIVHFERAVSLKQDYADAHYNLANTLAAQGKIDQAIVHFKRTLGINPAHVKANCNLLLHLNYSTDADPAAVYDAHMDFGKRFEAPLTRLTQGPASRRSVERRLRIGYVSSDFRQHSVAYFIEPVLAHHDHDRFEVYCYFNSAEEDEVTKKLKLYAEHWRNISQLSDEQAAMQIFADQIDILIDLNGHTKDNRLLVFARKPAPIQATWLGYPNTTGLSAMDYRITDCFADPSGMTENLHTEQLLRLPECFSCYKPPADAPEVSELPALNNGYITFGSFNNLTKITPEVKAVWARILQAVPGARLVIKNTALGEGHVEEMVREAFSKLAVAPDRLQLLGSERSQKAHLARYWDIDIGLDTFPYNGTTTTCDALWMGVPVVTLDGRTHAGRVGVSQLSNLGLAELIGHSHEEYVAIALRLSTDLVRLRKLRKELRTRMAGSPLTDGQRFTRNLERAYVEMRGGH